MKIDLNCDVGEGMNNEHLLMPYISSCNIACGGHFGTAESINEAIKIALENKVKIGAHPSFPDKENFGRKRIEISKDDFKNSILNQLRIFSALVEKNNSKMHHIKPHGALYNAIANEKELASFFVAITKSYFKKGCFLYVPFDSIIEKVALQNEIPVKYEAFADRNYTTDLRLVSRNQSNAIIKNVNSVLEHVLRMVQERQVKTITGELKYLKADTICVHGDTKNAIEMVKMLNTQLQLKGIEIEKSN